MDKMEQTYAKLAYEVRLYKNQLSLIQREVEKITLTSLDMNNALKTVDSMSAGESLIPIGGGSFVKGEVKEETVLLGIGSGYVIEVEKPYAVEKMKKRGELTREAINKLTREYSKISAKLSAATKELKEIERSILISRRTEESATEDYI